MKPIYLDNASTTPLDERVSKAIEMAPFGNPGSLHSVGQDASRAVFRARMEIAEKINTSYKNIIFTSSATEANNLVLFGTTANNKGNVLISAVEHESIEVPAANLGRQVLVVPVNKSGVIDLVKFKTYINPQTTLVSVMYANNEIGSIQPIEKIAKIVKEYKEHYKQIFPLFHVDAAQAFQFLDCNVDRLGVDLMTLSAHKIYGPKGVGALYVRDLELITPGIVGGGQEQELRSGTENVPGIVGFAKAVSLINEKDKKKIKDLRDYLLKELKDIFPTLKVNGGLKDRLVNNLNIYLPGYKAEDTLIYLDRNMVSVSTGSACSARSLEPSKVILNLGYNQERARNSIRITLGRQNTTSEVNKVISIFKKLKNQLK